MDRDFFSQPVSRANKSDAAALFSSQPVSRTPDNLKCSGSETSRDNTQQAARTQQVRQPSVEHDSCSTEGTLAGTASPQTNTTSDTDINQLFDSYKCINEELTSLLTGFRSEKISLESRLKSLYQENKSMKLEIGRQTGHINDLNETSENLAAKLSTEESETRKKTELKLLEIHEIFSSVDSAVEFINDFIKTFSQSVTEAHDFCNNMKKDLKELKENSLKASSSYMNGINRYSDDYAAELSKVQSDIMEAESRIESGLVKVKENVVREGRFKQLLASLSQQTEAEQKRNKDLENRLLQLNSAVMKLNEELSSDQDKFETETKQLHQVVSQLTLKNSAQDSEISSHDEELTVLNEKYDQMVSDSSTYQEVLADKRHKNEIILQEIESLEKQSEILKEKHREAVSAVECKQGTEVEMKELEREVKDLVEQCKELEAGRKRAVDDNPADSLAAAERDLELAKQRHQQVLARVEAARVQLKQKQTTLSRIRKEGDALRDELNRKMLQLESDERIQETDDLRKGNEQLSADIKALEKQIEEKKEMTTYLRQLKLKQEEILQNFLEENEKEATSDDGEEKSDLSEEYMEAVEAMDKLGVTDLDSRLKSVAAAIEFNIKQTEEAVEANRQDSAQKQAQYQQLVKDLDADVEEHKNYCQETLAKLDSEKRYIQGKISSILNDVNTKRSELNSRVSKLAQSVNTALSLFEKIIEYYSQACSQKLESGTCSIHWDNTKEVLQEILLIPLHKLSKVRGMTSIDTFSASPSVYLTVITRARTLFNSILRESESKAVDYTCRKLMDMCSALYYQSDNPEALFSNKLNDTIYSTSSETEFNKN